MFFRPNNRFSKNNTDKASEHDSFDFHEYFSSRSRDDLGLLAKEVSPDAKDFFDSSIHMMLGTLPEDLADMSITMSKEALQQILFSSMVTGYISKGVESRYELEKLMYKSNSKALDEDSASLKSFQKPNSSKTPKNINKPKSIDDVL